MANTLASGFATAPIDRRAALIGGPDVWEIIAMLKGSKVWGRLRSLPPSSFSISLTPWVRTAVRYYGPSADEIDRRITLNAETRITWLRKEVVLS